MKQAWIAFVLCLGCFPWFSLSSLAAPNVILITLDGARYKEVFRMKSVLPKIKKKVSEGQIFEYRNVRIANRVGISLPGYISIMSGEFEKRCMQNECKNTTHSTFFDGLIDHYGFDPRDLATVASWENIGRAIELTPGRIYRDIGIQDEDKNDLPPWIGSRWDSRTFEHGLKYLEEKKPRAFYLSFVESDEYAHKHEYSNYVAAVQTLDDRLEKIQSLLSTMGEYGDETSIVVTTDHGRGKWWMYSIHGAPWGGAGHAWALVVPSPKYLREKKLERLSLRKYSHTQIRPTLETLLGLKPVKGRSLVKFVD